MNGTRLGSYPSIERAVRAASGMESTWLHTSHHENESQFATFGAKLVAGATAGMLGAFVGRESYQYSGFSEALVSIFREGGIGGLWRGATASMMRVAVGSAVQLSTYDSIKGALVRSAVVPDGVGAHLGSALLTGLVVTVAMNPLDVVSTRIFQAKPGFYAGWGDCFARTVKAEGILGLYKGLGAHYLRLGPHTVFTFVFLEQCRKLLGVGTKQASAKSGYASSSTAKSGDSTKDDALSSRQ